MTKIKSVILIKIKVKDYANIILKNGIDICAIIRIITFPDIGGSITDKKIIKVKVADILSVGILIQPDK